MDGEDFLVDKFDCFVDGIGLGFISSDEGIDTKSFNLTA